jgi:dephospho-CoA kinase
MSKTFGENRPLRIGITGGIGSGKTTVCRIFEQLGIQVYYADDRAKALMVESPEVRAAIIALLGEEAYFPDGSLNRPYISSIVFNTPEKLTGLNAIVHPAVFNDGEAWLKEHADAPYTLKEAALLFESGSHKALDKIIMVFAPKDLRIQRVMKRDKSPREAVEARISQQMPEEEKLRLSDYVIYNDGHHSLISQVWQLHQKLLTIRPSNL